MNRSTFRWHKKHLSPQITLLSLSLASEWSISNFPCSLAINITDPTAWKTRLFIACWDERWVYYKLSLPHLYVSIGWENVLFELGSEKVGKKKMEWRVATPRSCDVSYTDFITIKWYSPKRHVVGSGLSLFFFLFFFWRPVSCDFLPRRRYDVIIVLGITSSWRL